MLCVLPEINQPYRRKRVIRTFRLARQESFPAGRHPTHDYSLRRWHQPLQKCPTNPLAIEVHVGPLRMLFPDSLLCQLPREKAYLQRQQQMRRSAHHSETVACLRLPLESLTAPPKLRGDSVSFAPT